MRTKEKRHLFITQLLMKATMFLMTMARTQKMKRNIILTWMELRKNWKQSL